MVFNRTKFDRDFCVAGEKRFQELAPEQFKPGDRRNPSGEVYCDNCEQWVKVKKNGFYVRHKASQQGYKGQHDKRSGTPPRTRRS